MFARVLPEVVMDFDKTLSHFLCEGLVHKTIHVYQLLESGATVGVRVYRCFVLVCVNVVLQEALQILKTKLPPLPSPVPLQPLLLKRLSVWNALQHTQKASSVRGAVAPCTSLRKQTTGMSTRRLGV